MTVNHVFVLMLENRSYDHLLGFSRIEGTDAVTGAPTRANGLTGTESNTWQGKTYTVARGADYVMPADPPHEFADVLEQLCGPGVKYPAGRPYPPVNNSGYVAAYAPRAGGDPGEIMKCYAPEQLPVLNALAREFALCDNWYASVPGPTWPNRLFVHAASCGGLEHSPSVPEIIRWETIGGFAFRNGTIFDRLAQGGRTRRLYAGDAFPMVAALKGIGLVDIRRFDSFAGDLQQSEFPYNYVFIEPAYDVLRDYQGGNSQHPLGDVRRGEALIKQVYEAIRNSPHWTSSVLIVTWDEHGGFYDHAAPPPAPAPGDTAPGSPYNPSGFTFEQYGARVPALVISPWIAKNTIDHRVYDHASIPKIVETLFGLPRMTARDLQANNPGALLALAAPRTDTPAALPAAPQPMLTRMAAEPVARPEDPVDEGNLPAVVWAAVRAELEAEPTRREQILERAGAIRTRAQALDYLAEARQTVSRDKTRTAP
jgi:phospholipase C